MPDHPYCESIRSMQKFFERTLSCFDEGDNTFSPKPEMFTVAHQVAHTAQTIEWFIEGAFSPTGFTTDFLKHEQDVRKITMLADAKAWFERACAHALKKIEATSMAELQKPIAPGPIFGGLPRVVIFEAMTDHTAHHRGALAVYARLIGKVPPMPYM